MDLEEKFTEYLEQSDVVKTLNADLRDAQKDHELYPEIEKLTKELKKLKDQLASVTEIAIMKEKRDGARERLNLLKDILLAEMQQSGEQEVVAKGKKARITSAVKFERAE